MRTKGIGTIASFGIITFGLVSTFFTVHSLVLPPAPASAEPSYATSSEVGINVKESIKIAVDKDHLALVDGEGSTQIAPSASGTLVTGDVNVAVTTNAYGGYRLGVYTSDATTDMKHNNTSVNAVVSSIAGASGYDATTGLASLSPNTWGFRKYTEASNVGGNETPASWSNWYGVGNNSTNMAIIDIKDIGEGPSTYCNDLSQPVAESGCSSSSYDTYKVGFGANLTSSLPAGTYTNNIIFSALTNEASTFLTFNANAPSGSTVSGSMAPKSILKGSTVTLPNTTTFKRDGFGIKGWALTEGATTVASITQPDPSNPGSAITVQLTPGATVDVDSLISATGIPSSTTGPIPLYAVWDNAYIINYIANNPEGTTVTGNTPASTAILGLNTTIETNNYEIDGYTLKGWAFTNDAEDSASISEAGAKDLISGATFTTQQLITAASSAGQSVSTSTAGTVTLYAIWKNGYSEDTMQGWTDCASLATGSSVMLTDVRDNKEYAVKKLPDGKCWMMQNLTINGVELTPKDTNIADGNTYYLPKDGGAGSITDPSTKGATTGFNFANGYDNQAMFKFRSKDTGITNDSDTGYYNFYTATLGYSYYNDGKESGTAAQDICPANWRLPRTTDAGTTVSTIDVDNDFTYLTKQYTDSWNNTATNFDYYTSDSAAKNSMYLSAASPLATSINNNYAGFSYSGQWNSMDSVADRVGSIGYYWAASIYSNLYSYILYFNSSYIYPQLNGNSSKSNGHAVRCVNDYVSGYMQDFDSGSLASGASATLRDKRDNQKYTVYRIPVDATYPGTSDIANVAGKVIMTKDLNLGAVASVPGSASTIVANGTMTLSPEDSSFVTPTGSGESITVPAASISVINGTGNWDDTNSYSNKQYTTSGTSNYTNRGYYSWGAAMTVCPKGWRLPTDAEYSSGATSWNASTFGISKLADNNISTIQSSPWLFTLGGAYRGNFSDTWTYGYYWSSVQGSSTNSYTLRLHSRNGLMRVNDLKYNGLAVRCIAD